MDSKLLFIIASSFCILGSCLMYAISRAEERRKLRESEGNFNQPKPQKHQKGPEEEHITEDVKVERISDSTEKKEESEKVDEGIVKDEHRRNGYRIVAIILFGISLLISVWLVPMILSQNRREKAEKQEREELKRKRWEQQATEQLRAIERNKRRAPKAWDNTPEEAKIKQGRQIQERHVKKMQEAGYTYLQKTLQEVDSKREHFSILSHYKKSERRMGNVVHELDQELWDCDFFYYGEFETRYEGNGHLRWNEVDFIDGIFQNGWIEQGVGSVHLVGDRHYEGQFMNGYVQGFGRMIYADGRVEEGVFSQGKYSGKY